MTMTYDDDDDIRCSLPPLGEDGVRRWPRVVSEERAANTSDEANDIRMLAKQVKEIAEGVSEYMDTMERKVEARIHKAEAKLHEKIAEKFGEVLARAPKAEQFRFAGETRDSGAVDLPADFRLPSMRRDN
jgi:hypothetical protein